MTVDRRLSPPTLEPEPALLPYGEPLASPEVPLLLGYTRRVLRLPDRRTLGVFSFSSASSGNRLFLVDGLNLSSRSIDIPRNDVGSHGGALGTDGAIYVMPYRTGRAWCLPPGTDRFEPLDVPLPEGECTWDAIGAPNGKIYMGTYPHAAFCEYDPRSGALETWMPVAPDTTYVACMSVVASGQIRFKAFGPAEAWMLFDPAMRTFSPTDPEPAPAAPESPPPPDDTRWDAAIEAGGVRYGLGFPSGRLWRMPTGGAAPGLCGDTGAPAQPQWWLTEAAGGIVGIGYYGDLFRFDPAGATLKRDHLANYSSAGSAIMFLERVTPRCIIGAHYSQQNLFALDPETGRLETSPSMVADVPGEPMCAVGLAGRAYLGIYINAIVARYDPERPLAFGVNPRELLRLGNCDRFAFRRGPVSEAAQAAPDYHQTRPRSAVANAHQVFICTEADYNRLGGALVVLSPDTGARRVHCPLLDGLNLSSLAWDPVSGLLWGGTDRWGQMRSHPPARNSALVYAFDADADRVAVTIEPWPGEDRIDVLAAAHGVLLLRGRSEFALIDTLERRMAWTGPWPVPLAGRPVAGQDGALYFLGGERLYRWDVLHGTVRAVAAATGRHLVEVRPHFWVYADESTVRRVRLTPSPCVRRDRAKGREKPEASDGPPRLAGISDAGRRSSDDRHATGGGPGETRSHRM